jgi:LysR family transcriptional regulator, nitrogen assimilation regulatory protein
MAAPVSRSETMDIDALRCFQCVAKVGSLSRAAQLLNLTQPTLSRRIALLEQELGARLFTRHTRGVALSPSGELLASRAVQFLRQLDVIGRDIRTTQREPAGQLSVGLPPSLVGRLSTLIANEYIKRYPRVRVFLVEGINTELERLLVEGELDVALMPRTRLRLGSFTVEPVAVEDMVFATTKDLPDKSRLAISDIAEDPLVLAPLPNYMRWRVEVAYRQAGRNPIVAAETNSVSALVRLARSGVGSIIIPRSAIAAEIADRNLNAIPVRGLSVSWQIAAAPPMRSSVAAQTLIGLIRSHMRDIGNLAK